MNDLNMKSIWFPVGNYLFKVSQDFIFDLIEIGHFDPPYIEESQ